MSLILLCILFRDSLQSGCFGSAFSALFGSSRQKAVIDESGNQLLSRIPEILEVLKATAGTDEKAQQAFQLVKEDLSCGSLYSGIVGSLALASRFNSSITEGLTELAMDHLDGLVGSQLLQVTTDFREALSIVSYWNNAPELLQTITERLKSGSLAVTAESLDWYLIRISGNRIVYEVSNETVGLSNFFGGILDRLTPYLTNSFVKLWLLLANMESFGILTQTIAALKAPFSSEVYNRLETLREDFDYFSVSINITFFKSALHSHRVMSPMA